MRRAGLALALLVLGCAGAGVDLATLPEAPLVFVWRTEEEASRRASFVSRSVDPRAAIRDDGRRHLDDLASYFGLGLSQGERIADFQGRLAFLDPRTSAIEVAGFAPRGAKPFDWTPDYERLLFRAESDGTPQLFEWHRREQHVRRLTSGPAAHTTACYGPDGRIAYSESRRGASGFESRIWITGPGGSEPRAVSPGPRDAYPAWSPDGRWLLYGTGEGSASAAIALLDLTSDTPPRVVARGRRPSFAPDGSLVVYSARTQSGSKLFRMRPDGSGKRPLGAGPLEEHAPTVSSDGRYVVYVAEENHRQQLRLRVIDGTGDRPLVIRGDGFSPIWN